MLILEYKIFILFKDIFLLRDIYNLEIYKRRIIYIYIYIYILKHH